MGAENVTERFQIAIRFGFWLTVINFGRAVCAQVSIWINSPLMLYTSFVLQAITMCLFLVLFVFMQMWRWCVSGRVCSGEFLPEHVKAHDYPQYLIVEGKFL